MFIKNDIIFTLAAGNYGGASAKSGDTKSLAQMGDFTASTTNLSDEMLAGEKEAIEEIVFQKMILTRSPRIPMRRRVG